MRLLDKKIDPDLFARLMQLPARARKDLFEYIGQGPMVAPSPDELAHAASSDPAELSEPDRGKGQARAGRMQGPGSKTPRTVPGRLR